MFADLMRAKKGMRKLGLPAFDVDANWVWNNSYRPDVRTATSYSETGNSAHRNQGWHWEPTQAVKGGFVDLTVSSAAVSYCEDNFLALYDKAQANVFSAANYNRGSFFGAAWYLNYASMHGGAVTNNYASYSDPRFRSVDFTSEVNPLATGFRFQIGWFDKAMWMRHEGTTFHFALDYAPNAVFFGCAIYTGTMSVDIHDFHFLY